MRPRVYIETTVISYLTAWRSPQLVMAAQQEATRAWWDEQRERFELFISEAVVQEASLGDPDAVQSRLEVIAGLPELSITVPVRELAKRLVAEVPMPERARMDALHIAVATVNGMDYLLTWNCRHIANATLRNVLAAVCQSADYEMPVICTPLELLEERSDD